MLRAGLDEDLGGRAPDDDDAVALVLRLEVADVLANLLGQLQLVRGGLYVGAGEALDVLAGTLA